MQYNGQQSIAIFGLGVVGLSMAAFLTSRKFKVLGIDIDDGKIRGIRKGHVPFYEPGLQHLLRKAISHGLLSVSTDPPAIIEADTLFISVGTPMDQEGSADLAQVKEVCLTIGRSLKSPKRWHLIAVRSTVPPGSTENLVRQILERESGLLCGDGFGLAVNPEFLREGSALYDLAHPDRIVIGALDRRSERALAEFYYRVYGEATPKIICTTPANAELIKYASNAFLSMKVSLINTLANMCRRVQGADVQVVAEGMALDKRIGSLYLQAGLGYGGGCLLKDLAALISFSQRIGYKPDLLDLVRKVNETQPLEALALTRKLIGDLHGKRVAILGLSFKPNTDNLQEATSLKIIDQLLREGAEVKVYDPASMLKVAKIYGKRLSYARSAMGCIKGCDCCIVVTEWEEFKKLRPENFLGLMRTPAVVDGRRIFDPDVFRGKLKFAAIGLATGD